MRFTWTNSVKCVLFSWVRGGGLIWTVTLCDQSSSGFYGNTECRLHTVICAVWQKVWNTKISLSSLKSCFFSSKRGFTSWLLGLNWPMNQHIAADSTPALVEGNMTDLISSKIWCFCSASKAQKSTLSVNSLFENGDSLCIYYTPQGETEAEYDRCYRNL